MSDRPMTEQEIEEARALASAATPGPWRNGAVERERIFCKHGATLGPERVLARMNNKCGDWTSDAAFIAASRELVPRLLAEVDRLRTENRVLRAKGSS